MSKGSDLFYEPFLKRGGGAPATANEEGRAESHQPHGVTHLNTEVFSLFEPHGNIFCWLPINVFGFVFWSCFIFFIVTFIVVALHARNDRDQNFSLYRSSLVSVAHRECQTSAQPSNGDAN